MSKVLVGPLNTCCPTAGPLVQCNKQQKEFGLMGRAPKHAFLYLKTSFCPFWPFYWYLSDHIWPPNLEVTGNDVITNLGCFQTAALLSDINTKSKTEEKRPHSSSYVRVWCNCCLFLRQGSAPELLAYLDQQQPGQRLTQGSWCTHVLKCLQLIALECFGKANFIQLGCLQNWSSSYESRKLKMFSENGENTAVALLRRDLSWKLLPTFSVPCIGIKNADSKELTTVASTPTEDYFFYVTDFKILATLLPLMSRKVCATTGGILQTTGKPLEDTVDLCYLTCDSFSLVIESTGWSPSQLCFHW